MVKKNDLVGFQDTLWLISNGGYLYNGEGKPICGYPNRHDQRDNLRDTSVLECGKAKLEKIKVVVAPDTAKMKNDSYRTMMWAVYSTHLLKGKKVQPGIIITLPDRKIIRSVLQELRTINMEKVLKATPKFTICKVAIYPTGIRG